MKLRTKFIAALSACAIITASVFAYSRIFTSGLTGVALDTPFQMYYASNANHVSVNLDLTCHLTDSGGESATVIMEISPDWDFCFGMWGFCEHWQEVARVGNSLTGTVPSGVSITNTKTAQLTHMVNQAEWIRLRTVTSGAAPSITLLTNSTETTP